MKRYIIAFFAYTFYILGLTAQTNSNIYISILPYFGSEYINLADGSIKINDSLKIDVLKFYISDIKFFNKGNIVFTEDRSYHLIDASEAGSLNFTVSNPDKINFDQVQFSLGIDSTINVSGALGGDLDPTKGMYWAWQSGYINLKLEGKSKSAGNAENEFQFHLGGYKYPNNAIQTIKLDIFNLNVLVLKFDIKYLFDSIDLNSQANIMSPGKEAVKVSKSLQKSFKLLEE